MIEHLIPLCAFFVISVASYELSRRFKRIGLPIISGLLIIGIITGPYVLNMVSVDGIGDLFFIGDISLAFIAFAAGNELRIKELRKRWGVIKWLTIGQLLVTFSLLSIGIYLLADMVPYFQGWPVSIRVVLAMLTAAVLCARSPASVIAVVNEMRARGPYTNAVMGTTVLVDFLVITLFTVMFAITGVLIAGTPFSLIVIGKLLSEIAASLVLAFGMSRVLKTLLSSRVTIRLKSIVVLAIGFGAYLLTYAVGHYSQLWTGYTFHLEPLLICILGSFILSNYTVYRQEFTVIIHRLADKIYCVFFTYAGMLLALDVIGDVWLVALIIMVMNMGLLALGTYVGARVAGDDARASSLYWTAFLTQAGVGLGLATTVNNAYPEWGQQFAAVVISVIVVNQLLGPTLFKWAIKKIKESHIRAGVPQFDGIRDAIIMGFETQSVALARQLMDHGWDVKLATRNKNINREEYPDLKIQYVENLNLEALEQLKAKLSEAIILMFTDEENLTMCELIYEHVGTKDVVVRLNHRYNFNKFHELGALVVDPSTAIVSLLDHMVRSPQATSLLLGMQEGQDSIDLQVLNQELFGITLRDLKLPNDVIVLSIRRKGQMIISHGYTRLRKGDWVTLVGSTESLQKMIVLFD